MDWLRASYSAIELHTHCIAVIYWPTAYGKCNVRTHYIHFWYNISRRALRRWSTYLALKLITTLASCELRAGAKISTCRYRKTLILKHKKTDSLSRLLCLKSSIYLLLSRSRTPKQRSRFSLDAIIISESTNWCLGRFRNSCHRGAWLRMPFQHRYDW